MKSEVKIKGRSGELVTYTFDFEYSTTFEFDCEVKLELVNLNVFTKGYTSVNEVEQFYNELKKSLADLNGDLHFNFAWKGIDLEIKFKDQGLVDVGLVLKDEDFNLSKNSKLVVEYTFETDQSYLQTTLTELKVLLQMLKNPM